MLGGLDGAASPCRCRGGGALRLSLIHIWLAIPEIVIQIGFGIILGPYVLDLAHLDNVVTGLSDLGLTFLIFLAGYELDLQRIRGKPLEMAAGGWGISLVIGLGAAFALVSTGLARDTLVIGLALTTTALGTLVPMLRDAHIMETRFGSHISACLLYTSRCV